MSTTSLVTQNHPILAQPVQVQAATQPIPRIWEQQDGEPNRWYDMFVIYRNLGPSRSIVTAWRQWHRREQRRLSVLDSETELEYSERASDACYTYASEWNWSERANAYDEYIQSHADREVQQLVKQWQVQAVRDWQGVWGDLVTMWQANDEEMSPNQISQAMKTTSREIQGMIPEVQTGIDVQIVLDKLPADLQSALAQALKLT